MDLGARGTGERGAAASGRLVSVVPVVGGGVVDGGLGGGGLVFGRGVGAVAGGCDGAKSWSSSRRWLRAVKAAYMSCCC